MTGPAARSVTVGMDRDLTEAGDRLTSTQIGRIGESLVASQLMLASAGRLSPFAPVADDDGTDLVLVDKATGALCRLQVKSRIAPATAPPPYVQFDVRLKTFTPRAYSYILAVLLDREAVTIWRAWLIPTGEIEGVAKRRTGNLVITPNPSPASADRYTPWRCRGMREVAERIAGG